MFISLPEHLQTEFQEVLVRQVHLSKKTGPQRGHRRTPRKNCTSEDLKTLSLVEKAKFWEEVASLSNSTSIHNCLIISVQLHKLLKLAISLQEDDATPYACEDVLEYCSALLRILGEWILRVVRKSCVLNGQQLFEFCQEIRRILMGMRLARWVTWHLFYL